MGKIVIVIGVNFGFGKEIVRDFVYRGLLY